MAERNGAGDGTGVNAAAQAIMAVVLVGGLAAAAWVTRDSFDTKAADPKPAVCPAVAEAGTAGRSEADETGAQLCRALNRPDLPTLLGTPRDMVRNASGKGGEFTHADGRKTVTPEAEVGLEAHSVKLSATSGELEIADMARLLGPSVERTTVLGHPAVLYSDRTIALTFRFDGQKSTAGQGGIARRLIVAKGPGDGGGWFEVVVWRQDDRTPDDGALFRVAEQVLPAAPGWAAG
ncbi:DUF6215 domain-containing protein [Streptomyces sp. NPDC096339]|uniref:DUF6215 domain-containing protein n=1 Tax=Streptomyces sp. NPDC096339 TaxID=3366086 RepID=UPI0038239685